VGGGQKREHIMWTWMELHTIRFGFAFGQYRWILLAVAALQWLFYTAHPSNHLLGHRS
jgi:hypothetical protein